MPRVCGFHLFLLGCLLPGFWVRAQEPDSSKDSLARHLEPVFERAIGPNGVPGLAVVLVDGPRVVWDRGMGVADPSGETPNTPETLHRVGSISKLFTDLALMRRVEAGQIDLDAPVEDYLPSFQPKNPFEVPITLRQLMSHRSGLVRESPVGSYFDETAPTLAATVESLNQTTLVYKPGTRTKYSNAGVAVVGRVLEVIAKKPFEEVIAEEILGPMGLTAAGFRRPDPSTPLAEGLMWTYDGREFPAPTFDLGTLPAGNLYASARDLGAFLSMIFAEGETAKDHLISPGTLNAMMEPQFADEKGEAPFGLGFALGRLDGHRTIGHGGAVYGFSSELLAIPEKKLGVVVLTNRDVANGLAGRLARFALQSLLASHENQALPAWDEPDQIDADQARPMAGVYGDTEQGVEVELRWDRPFVRSRRGGYLLELRESKEGTVRGYDVQGEGPVLSFEPPNFLNAAGDRLERRENARPEPLDPAWAGLIGEYGWDHNVLYILERDGRLHALIEWFFEYPLTQESADVYAFPDWGLYHGEKLIFQRDSGKNGRASAVEAASVVFPRRPISGEDGETFRVDPIRNVEELRKEVADDQPPQEPGPFRKSELVSLVELDPTIRLDVRYATTNNFLSTPFYTQAAAYLQRPAAEALVRVHQALEKQGFGLLIHDAYRPWAVTKMFYEATPEESRGFVADPTKGSRHNRGCAVDLTLFDRRTGEPVEMVAGYDEFSDRSSPFYPGGTSLQRWHREILRRAMEAEGFRVIENEWWHFDYRDWSEYGIQNDTFEKLGSTD